MIISNNIPLDVGAVINEMIKRQNLPWNNGRINDDYKFELLNKLFAIINSGIPKEEFMFRGDLFRIHSAYTTCTEFFNPAKEIRNSKICSDSSFSALPITEFSNNVVAFSKSPDFSRSVFYKVCPSLRAVLLRVNTGFLYGIDVNAFYHQFGVSNDRFEDEKEVLFPLTKDNLVKEYCCTPNQFKYYMRNAVDNDSC